MIKKIFIYFSIMITFFYLINCNKETMSSFNDNNKAESHIKEELIGNKLIESNIYYQTYTDAAVLEFRKSGIDYKSVVFNEFLPVVKEFKNRIVNHDLNSIIRVYLSPQVQIEIMKGYSRLNHSFKTKDDFFNVWIDLIKHKKEKVFCRTPLNFIINESIPWNEYKWIIEPNSYLLDNGKFTYGFYTIVSTGQKDNLWYAFSFVKEGKVYKLREVDRGSDEGVPPFYR